MKRKPPSRATAQAIFEAKLLAAEKQGTLCNIGSGGRCGHQHPSSCWADLYTLLFKALNYGRRRKLISIINPWSDRSWIPASDKPAAGPSSPSSASLESGGGTLDTTKAEGGASPAPQSEKR